MDDVSEAVRYVPRPRRLSCPGLFGLFWSGAALRTRAAKYTGDQLDRPPIPIPSAYTCSDYIHLMDVMSCLPDLRRCATRLV